MDPKVKMNPVFRKLEGGLFSNVSKADVGGSYASLAENGVTLMGWADPFFPDPAIPEHVLKAALECLQTGFPAHYTMPIGNLDLRKELAVKLKKQNGIDADPERNILVTPGSDAGLFYAMMPFLTPGDEVLVPSPGYPNSFLNPELLGGKTVRVPLRKEDGYQPDIREFRKRLTPKTRMVVLTHPNNPTTTVFRKERLLEIAHFVIENDLVLVVDQAFEDTVFDGVEYVNMASLPGMRERTVSVFSISKGMGLSGFRVGYLVACDVWMDAYYGGCVNVLGATNTMAQIAAITALRNNGYMDEYKRIHDRRRKSVYEILNAVPGVRMAMPESGFYSWIDVSRLGDSTDIAAFLIRDAQVAVNDGKSYGEEGAGHLRIIHGSLSDESQAMDAISRIANSLRTLIPKGVGTE
ncbi:pyridoxal phosphate-dependent aminotransferase [Paenibacillaceae bacterium WGS1546]|uniref:pyridoxal phosphate-dependent aminotransferase n=1 Tax=Cohnella sp. WGS1546 TaxID=3366810 RepID=UPI00372D4153